MKLRYYKKNFIHTIKKKKVKGESSYQLNKSSATPLHKECQKKKKYKKSSDKELKAYYKNKFPEIALSNNIKSSAFHVWKQSNQSKLNNSTNGRIKAH